MTDFSFFSLIPDCFQTQLTSTFKVAQTVPVAAEEAQSFTFIQNLPGKPSQCFGFSPSQLIKA